MQIGIKMVSRQNHDKYIHMIHHGPHLGGIPIFSFIVYVYMVMGTTYKWPKNSQTPKWKTFKKFQNFQVINLTISRVYNFCIWILIWESSKAKL
jgi:hypothetical protein